MHEKVEIGMDGNGRIGEKREEKGREGKEIEDRDNED